MKILLINVSRRWEGRVYREYPLGLGILGTIIRQDGHEVYMYDMAVQDTPLDDIVKSFAPDVTGLSFLSTSSRTATGLIPRLKEMGCGHLLAGGIHPSIFPGEVLRAGADVVAIGEGEGTILPLLHRLRDIEPSGLFKKTQLADIPGLGFRSSSGEVIVREAAHSVDLDSLPMIDRSLFDMNLYHHHSMISSRGCVYGCKFCCAWGPGGEKGRFLSAERILQEIASLAQSYGPLELYWADDMFFFHHRDRMQFLKLLREQALPVRWYLQLRPDSVNREIASALRESGCVKIGLGAESGSNKILRTIGKGTTRQKLCNAITTAKDAGLKVKTWWILGLPGGSYSDQLESLDVIRDTRPNEVAIHSFVPMPGSEFWVSASKYGITRPSLESLEDLHYYSDPAKVSLSYISSQELINLTTIFDQELRSLGYVDTDHAQPDDEFVFTSPLQESTFSI